MKRGGAERKQENITLIFSDDRLMQVEGDYRPQPAQQDKSQIDKETVVTVPDYTGDRSKGFVTRVLNSVGVNTND